MCRSDKQEQYITEASNAGLTLIGKGKNRYHRLYRFNDCGHEQEITLCHVRYNSFECKTCKLEKHKNEASNAGLTLIGKGSKLNYRLYRFNDCGHEKEINVNSVRDNSYRNICKTCLENRYHLEASNAGLTLIGKGRNSHYRLYKCRCGHEQEITIDCVKQKKFRCQHCGTNIRGYDSTKQGLFYLYRWTHPTTNHSFMKFGITNHVDHTKRIKQQSLETEYNPEEITTRYFINGTIPQLLEKLVRKSFYTGVIDKEHFKDGYTETVEDCQENIDFVLNLLSQDHYNKAA